MNGAACALDREASTRDEGPTLHRSSAGPWLLFDTPSFHEGRKTAKGRGVLTRLRLQWKATVIFVYGSS